VENSDNYYNTLKREIEMRMIGTNEKTMRAILVFFENDVKLMNFLNCKSYKSLKEKTRILTERA
jgi:preprotein translocase subunit SecA